MLTQEENDLLTRVGAGTPMGEMMRRYWLPACLSEELPEPDCTPVRVRLLGQNLVAFRDTEGKIGILDEGCPHRLASLALGRNEEGGIRCVYHGWKFDVAGRCVEMPTEPGDSTYKNRLRARAYPVRESGDLVWIYMGPAEKEPPFPEYDWATLPKEQRAVVKIGQRSNWLQAIEGAIDSAHSWFLHRGVTPDWQKRSSVSSDLSPKLEAEDTDYGMRYGAIRKPNEDPEKFKYVRVTLYAFPVTAFIPRPLDRDQHHHVQLSVPVDDDHTMFYGIFASQNGAAVSTEDKRKYWHAVPGVDVDSNWFKVGTVENWFNQDRSAMKAGDWVGIKGITNQDMACQESMGLTVDRTQEHLGTSDVAIIKARRRLLESVKRVIAGEDPIGVHVPVPHERLRSEQLVIPIGQPWQSVGAYAGEYAAPHESAAKS
jgi:phthalate 4,5-dioxygenase oxygenase subunit